MFDNNMNNPNNNVQPLFGNSFENQNDVNLQNDSNNFNQPVATSNFSMSGNYNPYQSVPSVEIDTPPELSEIKNLNEATITTGPSLDVLGPMNLMPESFPPKDNLDRLDAYESGALNLEGEKNMTPNNFDNQDIISNNNIYQSNFSSDMPQNLNDQNFLNNDFNQIPQQDGLNNVTDNLNSNIQIDNTSLNEVNPIIDDRSLNDYKNTYDFNNEESNPLPKNENNQDNIYEVVENKIEDSDEKKQDKTENNEKDEIEEDDFLNEEKQDLSTLGLDESYTEPDMLEIMDLEAEEENQEMDSASKNVEKIKNLVEELKLAGAKIELQEFDFDSMYQLIVKLDK